MRHPDESLALAALFDCWTPKWKTVRNLGGFTSNLNQALIAFGFKLTAEAPFWIGRMTTDGKLQHDILLEDVEQAAILLTPRQIYSPGFLFVFRRHVPARIILAAKSGLWWSVWDGVHERPTFDISTAEYLPRGKHARSSTRSL